MKITIEGDEDECRAAACALAMGFQERHCPRVGAVAPPTPESLDEFMDRVRTPIAVTGGYRECCKTDTCRLPKSHPDYRSDP